jgi:hypothetical protein
MQSHPARLNAFSRRTAVVAALMVLSTSLTAPAGESADFETMGGAKNLARMNVGARIELITPAGPVDVTPNAGAVEGNAASLIMDDQTVSCPLPEGETTFVIALRKASVLNRFTFVNENAEARGDMRIAVSNFQIPASSPKWSAVDGVVSFTNKRVFNLSMLGVEAKYVRVSFHVEQGGRIAAFGQRNDVMKIANTSRSKKPEDVLNYNFANIYARSRIVYVSSGRADLAGTMIDDDAATSFKFAQTDARPTVVVELAQIARVHRVSALYRMGSGRLDIYLLNELDPKHVELDKLKPVASVTERRDGKAAIDFDPCGARYVALVWTPDTAARDRDRGLEVAELGAFGNVALASLDIGEPLNLFVSNAMGSPGEGSHDFSNTLGTLAEPPVLSIVSP